MSHLFIKYAQTNDLDVTASNANSSSATQYTGIVSLIQGGAKALVVNPVDAKAIVPAVKYANAHHVPVVSIDDAPAGGDVYMVVQADNEAMAAKDCMAVGSALHGSGQVLMLDGDLSQSNGLQRAVGFTNCMKQNFPKITVFQQAANWSPTLAASETQTVMTQHPDIKAIYMATDTIYWTPVWGVLKRLGKAKLVGQPGHIFMASIDGSPTGLAAIKAHELDFMVSQPLNLYALWGAKYAAAALKGVKQSPGMTSHGPVKYVNGILENLVPSTSVTIENVSDPSLWGNEAGAGS